MKLTRQYFKHDYGARNDPKLLSVQARFGLAGIGFYWCLVESLYENGGELTTEDVSNLAFVLRFDNDDAQKLIKCFDLFEVEGDRIFSQSMKRRIEQTAKTSESRRNASNKRWATNQPRKPKTVPIRYEDIKNAWNRICGDTLRRNRLITDDRKNKIRIRFGQMTPDVCQAYDVADPYQLFEKIFGLIMESPFLKGSNDRGWTADFDWVIGSPTNWQKVADGRYTNMGRTNTNKKQENNINVNDIWK